MHPVRPMQLRLPAQRDPREVLSRDAARRARRGRSIGAGQCPRLSGVKFRLQFICEDCTGCGLCVESCPAERAVEVGVKAINIWLRRLSSTGARDNSIFRAAADERSARVRFRKRARRAVPASRCSSFPALARGAARRRILSCSRSCSATACRSPTPPAVRLSTAATCRRRRGPPNSEVRQVAGGAIVGAELGHRGDNNAICQFEAAQLDWAEKC